MPGLGLSQTAYSSRTKVSGHNFIALLLLLLILFLILLVILHLLLCASRLSTRQSKIDRPLVYREQRDLPEGTNSFIVAAFAVTIVIIEG